LVNFSTGPGQHRIQQRNVKKGRVSFGVRSSNPEKKKGGWEEEGDQSGVQTSSRDQPPPLFSGGKSGKVVRGVRGENAPRALSGRKMKVVGEKA